MLLSNAQPLRSKTKLPVWLDAHVSVTPGLTECACNSATEERLDVEWADVTSRLVLEAAGDGIYGLDSEGFVTFVNPAAVKMTGWTLEEMREQRQHDLIHHSHQDGSRYEREDCPIYATLRDGTVHHTERDVFWRKDGSFFPVAYTSTPILINGRKMGAVTVFRDISAQLQERSWDRSKTAIFSSILSQAPLDDTLDCIAASLTSLRPSFGVGVLVREGSKLHLCGESKLGPSLRPHLLAVPLSAATQPCGKAVMGKTAIFVPRPEASTREGCNEAMEWSLPLSTNEGEVLGALSLFGTLTPRDMEELDRVMPEAADLARLAIEHHRLHVQLSYQARFDTLTGLANRTVLEDRLKHAMVAARQRGGMLAVCYIDLDRFKEVNDTLGHAAGDEYLQRVTQRLQTRMQYQDTLARQGGDEFIVLMPDVQSHEQACERARDILAGLQQPFQVGDRWMTASASMGVSVFPDHGETSQALLQMADTALYAAKHAGRSQIRIYDSSLGDNVRHTLDVQVGLQQALEQKRFRLVYQPIFDGQRQLHALEALLRWDHPESGEVLPASFIQIAEESGQIVPIGAWVLGEACRQMAAWHREGTLRPRLFVNVSAVQLNRDDFEQTVADALAASGLPANVLEIEITESWFVTDTRAAAKCLRRLQALGIKVSLDDFGTGQSSLGSLHELPIDTVKIDKSFIARLDGSGKHSTTLQAIVALAQQFGMRAVAEGVESELQEACLRQISGDLLLQGYLLARPLDAQDVAALLHA